MAGMVTCLSDPGGAAEWNMFLHPKHVKLRILVYITTHSRVVRSAVRDNLCLISWVIFIADVTGEGIHRD